ncbi:MAG: SUF system NifU family Fe-S cluster assembly protein [Deltaproteobacteria bacterium]|jgi:nitrogen fixation NifU-like protein|nr:SUF system NifU family Fe-S cluster assembly protein [Deltaproteobacteria bacterium]MBW2534903.1 SUF system NifU family Fe-S cluster assembly protein [Deltaproteobacteria bacterium]
MALDALYREVVLDHHRNPRGDHPLSHVDARAEGYNPSCGDEVEVEIELCDGRICDVGVHSRGCAISVASGSMLAELLAGRSLDEATRITEALQRMLRGETERLELDEADSREGSAQGAEPSDPLEDFEDLEALAGVRQLPARIKCAALPWMTLLEALERRGGDSRDDAAGGPSRTARAATTEGGAWDPGSSRSRGARALPGRELDDANDR